MSMKRLIERLEEAKNEADYGWFTVQVIADTDQGRMASDYYKGSSLEDAIKNAKRAKKINDEYLASGEISQFTLDLVGYNDKGLGGSTLIAGIDHKGRRYSASNPPRTRINNQDYSLNIKI